MWIQLIISWGKMQTLAWFCPCRHRMEQKKQGEWRGLKETIEQRCVMLAQYIIEQRSTVRGAAKRFGVSKSTVHKDLAERLPGVSRSLFLQVKEVLEENKAQRHIRGGQATREKYLARREGER